MHSTNVYITLSLASHLKQRSSIWSDFIRNDIDKNMFIKGFLLTSILHEISEEGKKFELPKKSNFFPFELFSSNFFGSYGSGGATTMADHSSKLVPNDEE